jgi:hypothetical protein
MQMDTLRRLTAFNEQFPNACAGQSVAGDGFGNPLGLDAEGRVWLSDHDSCERVCLEDWLRRWALRVEAHRSGDYLARWCWPTPDRPRE